MGDNRRKGYITTHTTVTEATCPCGKCDSYALHKASAKSFALTVFEVHRRATGDDPIIITSWGRCVAYNVAVGGHKVSRHLTYQAMDLGMPNIETACVHAGVLLGLMFAGLIPKVMVGVYRRHLHMQLHRKGGLYMRPDKD